MMTIMAVAVVATKEAVVVAGAMMTVAGAAEVTVVHPVVNENSTTIKKGKNGNAHAALAISQRDSHADNVKLLSQAEVDRMLRSDAQVIGNARVASKISPRVTNAKSAMKPNQKAPVMIIRRTMARMAQGRPSILAQTVALMTSTGTTVPM